MANATADGLSGKHILIVEDEKNIMEILLFNLKKQGAVCESAYDGERGLELALSGKYDIILLDLMLPKLNGFDVCRQIRESLSTPIVMVTAREDETDKVMGLELGADDYITKPFSIKELIARVKANIRRYSNEPVEVRKNDEIIRVGKLVIDNAKYEVTKNGVYVKLTKKEYELLSHFSKHIDYVFTREELLEQVWGYEGFYGDVRAVDVAISRLRVKIEDDPAAPLYIQNRRGKGYYMTLEHESV